MTEKQQFLAVFDTSATSDCPERTHEIMFDGVFKKFVFKANEPLVLPFHEGVKFQRDGFIVRDADTDEVLKTVPVTNDAVRFQIGDDQVVARYDELTLSALRMRAAALPGGETFVVGDHQAADIIGFIKAGGQVYVDMDPEPEETEDSELVVDPEAAEGPLPTAPEMFGPPAPTGEITVDPEAEAEDADQELVDEETKANQAE